MAGNKKPETPAGVPEGFELILSLKGHTGNILWLAWSPDGERLASASEDQTLCIWNSGTGQVHRRLKGHGVAVRVDPRSYFQPDASVTCAEQVDPDAIEVPDPIVVEVVSPGTRVRHQTVKLVDYFMVPSVQHYLPIETRRRLVLHHRRGAEGEVVTRFLRAGRLRLDPPGIQLEIAALYAGTDIA